MSQKAKAFKNLMFSSAGVYIESFFAMIMSIIIARALGPESYGNYALIIWMCALGIRITNGGVTTALIKFIAECRIKYEERISSMISYLRKIQLIKLVIVLFLFSIIFITFQDRYFQNVSIEIFLLLMFVIILKSFHMFYISLSKGFENFKVTAAIALIASPIHLILVVAAALISNTFQAFIIVYALSAIVYLLASRNLALKWCRYDKNDIHLSSEMKTRVKKHVSIVMINTLLLFLITKESELLFLKYYADGDDLGFFKVAHRLAFAIALLLPGIFEGIMLPLMSSGIARSKQAATTRFIESIKYVMILAIPAAVFCVYFAEEIILVMYGAQFKQAIVPFSIIAATCCICSLATVPTSYLLSVDKQSLILKVMLIGTILKLGLDFYLVSKYGLYGAAIAFSLAFSFMFMTNLILAMKDLGVAFPWLQLIRVSLATIISLVFILSLQFIQFPNLLIKLLAFSIIFLFIYLVSSLLVRCWRPQEINFIRRKIASYNLAILKPLDLLFKWAAK